MPWPVAISRATHTALPPTPFPMVLKIPSATSAQPYLSSYRILPSPWAQGRPQHNSWAPAKGYHPSAQVLCGASSAGRSGVTARGGLYLCLPQPTCLSEDTVDGLLICATWEGHLRLTLLVGWTNTSLQTAHPGPWAGAPLHQRSTYIVWLLLPLNNLRFLAPAWKYRAPRQSLLTWQTCYWVPHNSQGGTASSP